MSRLSKRPSRSSVLFAAVAAIVLVALVANRAHAQTMTNSFGGLSKNSGEPINIESDVLVVHDAQKYATFKGNVKAVQGTTTLRSRELDVHYVGSGSDSLTKGPDTKGATPTPQPGGAQPADTKVADAKPGDAKPGGASTADAKPGGAQPSGVGLNGDNGTQISKIEARGDVVITSDQDQTTTSDWALYDVPAQLVTVGGDVVLVQGKNVLKGDRLVIDLKTGESRFENPGDTGTPGRIRALFMPKDAKPGDDDSKDNKSGGDKSADKSGDKGATDKSSDKGATDKSGAKGAGKDKAAAAPKPAAVAEPAADVPMPILPGGPQ
jgi:lipopolysaccharide export system protein LptA